MRPKALCFLALLCLLVSCVKDTDFDQADQITLSPVYELDLVFFTVNASQFESTEGLGTEFAVTDFTDIRFLDDSFVSESLTRAEVFFRFTNDIPRDFVARLAFTNLRNEVQYEFEIPIAGRSASAPVITEHIEIFETEEDLQALTSSSRFVISVVCSESPQGLEGTLNLQSKSTYYLEY